MALPYSFLVPLVFVFLITARADPEALQDFCVADTKSSTTFMNGLPCIDPNRVSGKHFMTSALGAPTNTSSNRLGFNAVFADLENLPGLNTLGITMARTDMAVGGVVPPHTHPRATEIIYVQTGSLLVGFVDTANRLYSQQIKDGDVFVFPKGMLHFVQNVGKVPAFVIVAYNSQNPGVSLVRLAAFASNPPIPVDVLAKSFAITAEEVEKIRKG